MLLVSEYGGVKPAGVIALGAAVTSVGFAEVHVVDADDHMIAVVPCQAEIDRGLSPRWPAPAPDRR